MLDTNPASAAADVSPASLSRRPKNIVAVRLANAVGNRLRRWGINAGDLAESTLLRKATRATGLDDFGDEHFLAPLRKLIESYESEDELTFVGRMVAQQSLVHVLSNRLKIRDELKRRPDIVERPVRRPLFVVGLPRTGTTLLHKLLSLAPDARPLLFWQSMSPAPPPDPERLDRDRRIRLARRRVADLYRAVPQMPAIHEFDPVGAEECLGLLMNTFVTPFFRGRLAQYRQWLYGIGDEELDRAYREYCEQLQMVQFLLPEARWVLKCPSHLFGLKALMQTFPDACIVHTHRDPLKALPSLCSLSAVLDGLSYSPVDWAEVGRRTLAIVDRLLAGSEAARAEFGPERILDLPYSELVADPVAAVRRVHEQFQLPFDAGYEKRIREYIAAHPRDRHGVHQYRLEEFGFDRDGMRAHFEAYCRAYDIRSEEDGDRSEES